MRMDVAGGLVDARLGARGAARRRDPGDGRPGNAAGRGATRSNVVDHDFFFFQAEDGIRDVAVTGVQTCALPICPQIVRGLLPALPQPERASPSLPASPENLRDAVLPSGDMAPCRARLISKSSRSEEHTSELQSRLHLVCRLLLEKKKSYT